MNKNIGQNQRVLNHLIDHGYITQLVASSYGVRRLASRIDEIQTKGGTTVEREMRKDDAGVKYAYYTLRDIDREYLRDARDGGAPWNAAGAERLEAARRGSAARQAKAA